jgi:hypothetical protein
MWNRTVTGTRNVRTLIKFTLDNCGKPQQISTGQPTISMQNKAMNSPYICSHINGNFMLKKNTSPISMAPFLE